MDREEIINDLLTTPAYEMSSVPSKRTGLKGKIWLDDAGISRDISHNNCRFKYRNNGDEVSIAFFNEEPEVIGEVTKELSDIKKVIRWTKLNREYLLKFYRGSDEYDIGDFLADMKPVK